MKSLLIFWAFLIVFLTVRTNASKYNVTYADLANCKEYHVNSSEYLEFFRVEHLSKGKTRNKTEVLRLKFYVLAAKDAHLLLTSSDHPAINDRVYEIVIGAGSNTFSELRENLKTRRLATVIERDVVSTLDPTPIDIVQRIDGTISVSIPGLARDPLLSYQDKNPIVVNYVSFSSFGKSLAKWFYDCNKNDDEEELEMEQKTLSMTERISIDLLSNASYSALPDNLTQITFGLTTTHVNYDHTRGIFNTIAEMKLYWTDDRLNWDPLNYDNTTFIDSSYMYIWQAQLKILNGAKETFKDFSPYSVSLVHFNGSMEMFIQYVEIDSWCYQGNFDWPNDDTVCEIMLGLVESNENIRLIHDGSSPLSNQGENELYEWDLQSITITDASRKLANGEIQNLVSLKYQLRRNSAYYKNVFYTPAYVSCAILLLSYCLDGQYRGALNLISILLTLITFLSILPHAPITYIPSIISHYQTLLLTASISYVFHIAFIWMIEYPPQSTPSLWIITVLKCFPLQFMLGLSSTNSVSHLGFEKHPWMALATILNRVLFILVTVFYIVVFFA